MYAYLHGVCVVVHCTFQIADCRSIIRITIEVIVLQESRISTHVTIPLYRSGFCVLYVSSPLELVEILNKFQYYKHKLCVVEVGDCI